MAVAHELGQSSAAETLSYEDLYRRWEQGNWQATAIDFSADRVGWAGLSDIQRRSATWLYSMFLYGEDAVAGSLSPYIDAAPTTEQKYFLASQQVDEARHAVFFHRFFTEVVGVGPSISETLTATRPYQNWAYRAVFHRLDRMAEELRDDRSLPKFAQAIALYHLVIEATMAQPGQHFIEEHFARAGSLPGFSEGMAHVAVDEQRHIGFGVKTLNDCFAASEECRATVATIMAEMFRYVVAVFIPPGWDREYTRCYGFELEDIYAFAIRSVRTKWRAAGFPLEDMPAGVLPIDLSLEEEELARRVIVLTSAGVLGEPHPRPGVSPEIQRLFFDTVARTIDPSRGGPRRLCIQWRFSDADPWHVVVEGARSRAAPGEAPDADVTIESPWKDWIDLAAHGVNPTGALLHRRLRIHGSPRALLRMPRLVRYRPRVAPAG